MIIKDIQQTIEEFLNQNLDSPSHFLVKVGITLGKVKEGRVLVLMDSDLGITIEECAVYSRKLGKYLEENDFFEHQYTLEIASPGLDFPLTTDRQFQKNINRKLHLELKDQKVLEGRFVSFDSDFIELETEEKTKGKKVQTKMVQVPREQVLKAKVTVSFK